MRKIYAIIFCFILAIGFVPITAEADKTGETKADITFQPGELSLTQMSSFSFGSHAITTVTKNYNAQESSINLGVMDLRGSGAGWKVTAIASPFTDGATLTLNGATISFLNGTASTTDTAGVTEPAVLSNIKLDCDGATSADVAEAAENAGMGSWTMEWNGADGDNSNVVANVPVPQSGTHVSTITWTLADAP